MSPITLALLALFFFVTVGVREMHNRNTVQYAFRCAYGYLVFQMPIGEGENGIWRQFHKNILEVNKPSERLEDSIWGAAHYLNDLAIHRSLNPRQQAFVFASVLGMTDYENVIPKIRTRKTVREVIYLAEKAMAETDTTKRFMTLVG